MAGGPTLRRSPGRRRCCGAGGWWRSDRDGLPGSGPNALDAAAVRRIFAAKGRPADNPLIVHVAAPEQARALARAVPPAAETLMSLWPGPLTLVLPRAAVVPDVTTAGQDTVAVRIPKHPAALALLRACGRPVAAPSANRSGRPSPTTAEHVHADLDGVVDVILDGGPCAVGLESTVVDVTRATPMVLRAGGPVARGAAVSRGRGRCALGTGP
ncbi:L-threonylcarbamoyladenylate synthase [Nannocystis sp. ncelm1]|uniref:L-threonylcarbamoyladenylate synthase n=1 Tax=Nannocystis radixulma TaxID=2995305 RepID=A0ABT5BPK0_9BACT|nr:L-threonylcarbamoyladenylate synthase [Nannocystis radixulma]MDC0675464.1 L-threonylcarbamoyladenylate synthase [Nannocystis radixulma]